MGGTQSDLSQSDVEELQRISKFSQKEIKKLYKRFKRLDKEHVGMITKDDLLSIPELAMNPLGTRRELYPYAPLYGLHTLSPLSTGSPREEKLKFAFKIYDVDQDGFVSKKDLSQVLKLMVGEHLNESQLSTIVNKTIEDGDEDGDEKLSYKEFSEAFSNSDFESKMCLRFKQ